MAVAVPYESLKRWTSDEVRLLITSGAFAHPERFELVDGLILEKIGQNEPHIVCLGLVIDAMRAVFGDDARVVVGIPLRLSESSEPEPDIMVTIPGLKRAPIAEDVLVIVEVADTSLRTDQTTKAAL